MDRFVRPINVKQLITFYKFIFLCGKFSTIVILYENSTVPMLEPILLSSSNYVSLIINTDLAKNYRNTTLNPHEHSLIVSAFDMDVDKDVVLKLKLLLRKYKIKSYGHYLFVTWNRKASVLHERLMRFADTYKLDNMGLILINPNGSFEISRITYDPSLVVDIPDIPNEHCSSIYDRMYHRKTKDLISPDPYVYILIDPPNVINLTSRSVAEREVISMGGRDAYLASVIPRKLNITLKLCTVLFSYDYNENQNEYKFLKEFMEKTYEEDNREPKQLDYTTVLQHVQLL